MPKKSYFLQISVIVKIIISEASCKGNKLSNSTGSCAATSNFFKRSIILNFPRWYHPWNGTAKITTTQLITCFNPRIFSIPFNTEKSMQFKIERNARNREADQHQFGMKKASWKHRIKSSDKGIFGNWKLNFFSSLLVTVLLMHQIFDEFPLVKLDLKNSRRNKYLI